MDAARLPQAMRVNFLLEPCTVIASKIWKLLARLAALAALMLALMLALAAPATAQMYSDGYKFLKAVKDKDGTVATQMLEEPGSTVVNARDLTSGETGLHIVVQRRDATWIKFLAQHGANPNIRDKNGITPLISAVRLGFNEGVEALIGVGADVDVGNATGETPLISAVHRRDASLMRILLEAGADPDRKDNSGRSARDYAQLEGNLVKDAITRYAKSKSGRAASGAVYGPSI